MSVPVCRVGLVAALLSLGCFHVGPTAEEALVAVTPHGGTAQLATNSRRVSGELLAMLDDGVLLRSDSRLLFAQYEDIQRLTVDGFDDSYSLNIASGAEWPTRQQRVRLPALVRLAALSRYPHGVDPALRRRLLSLSGQSDYEAIR